MKSENKKSTEERLDEIVNMLNEKLFIKEKASKKEDSMEESEEEEDEDCEDMVEPKSRPKLFGK